uniref:Membrane protein n=1 Tax=Magnetospirillum gryphiswaldense TaxID=55518 RepID=A4TUD2_9PROT|nr:membrane protein [Magnetospirillum gryphiswaldense MSR-1]
MTVTMSIPAYIPILAATTAAQSLVSLAMLSPAAVAPAIARDLQVSGAMIGWWISMAYGGAMITSLLGGNAVRRFGATRSTQIGLLLVCPGRRRHDGRHPAPGPVGGLADRIGLWHDQPGGVASAGPQHQPGTA